VQTQTSEEAFDRVVVVTESMADATEAGPERGVIGLVPEGLAVDRLGLGERAEALEVVGEEGKIRGSDHLWRPAE
jgi:hypothetical protein